MKRLYVSCLELEVMTRDLANKIKADNKCYEKIFTFPRGGLPGAVQLAHLLGIKELVVENPLLRALFFNNGFKNNFDEFIFQDYSLGSDGLTRIKDYLMINKDNALFFDDLSDSGRTLAPYQSLGFDTAVYFFKDIRGVKPPTYICKKVSKKVWIDFHYEQVNAPMKRDRDI
ncbi:hypothetical protein GF352_02550 [archaeon]|nr:hypothetical protein [archaeon]